MKKLLNNIALGTSVVSSAIVAQAAPCTNESLVKTMGTLSQKYHAQQDLSGASVEMQTTFRQSCELDWDQVIQFAQEHVVAEDKAIAYGTTNVSYRTQVEVSAIGNAGRMASGVCKNSVNLSQCLQQHLCDENPGAGSNTFICKP